MSRPKKKRSVKSGLPPGTLVHIGEESAGDVKISVIDYSTDSFREVDVASADQCLVFRDAPTVTWVNVEGIQNVDIIQRMGDCFRLHPLVLEDILNTEQRPKLEDYDAYLYIVVKMLHNHSTPEIRSEQISLILGPNFVLSFQEGMEGDVFNGLRERLRTGKGRIRGMGADYLAYSMLDAIVDHYFIIMEGLGERIEELEDELVSAPAAATLQSIHRLKREMIFLRRAVWPLREVVSVMERDESPLIRPTTKPYLRDVYDHTIQVIDAIESSRDMVSGMLDIYLSSLSNRMNEVMKFLTIIGTIFIPLTFIAGVYGMNFEHMPELKWRWGYFALLGFMAAVALFMLAYFRRKKWL